MPFEKRFEGGESEPSGYLDEKHSNSLDVFMELVKKDWVNLLGDLSSTCSKEYTVLV